MKPYRIFIEDEDEPNQIELEGHAQTAALLTVGLEKTPDNPLDFFDEIITDALGKALEVWEAIKKADEIYAATALIPLFGYGTSLGSAMLFNQMMYRAIEENITGKSIYLLREYSSIQWEELRSNLVDKAFKQNYLYVMSGEGSWEQVDIDKLIKEKLI